MPDLRHNCITYNYRYTCIIIHKLLYTMSRTTNAHQLGCATADNYFQVHILNKAIIHKCDYNVSALMSYTLIVTGMFISTEMVIRKVQMTLYASPAAPNQKTPPSHQYVV